MYKYRTFVRLRLPPPQNSWKSISHAIRAGSKYGGSLDSANVAGGNEDGQVNGTFYKGHSASRSTHHADADQGAASAAGAGRGTMHFTLPVEKLPKQKHHTPSAL
jgi:hypothetical protein